jgi:hypothetical protein
MKCKSLCALVAAAILSQWTLHPRPAMAAVQSNAFTYQGQLNANGALANGTFQFTFTLYNAQIAGSVIGSPIPQSIDVVNGLFSTDLNFGAGTFDGQQYWLDIQVGTTVANEQSLSARQPINATPVALYALNSPAGAGPAILHFSGTAPNRTTANSIALVTVNGVAYSLQCWFNTNTNKLIEELDANSATNFDVHEEPFTVVDSGAVGAPQFLNATNFLNAQLWTNTVNSGGHQEQMHMQLVIDLHAATEQVQQAHVYMRATTTGFGSATSNTCDIEGAIVPTG